MEGIDYHMFLTGVAPSATDWEGNLASPTLRGRRPGRLITQVAGVLLRMHRIAVVASLLILLDTMAASSRARALIYCPFHY
jgi:hypothetical protein